MHPLRTTFVGEIVAEFLLPRHNSSRVMILCDGLPTLPGKHDVMHYWSRKGFWVFHIRYRGTWESGGHFLDHAPEQDIWDVVRALPTGFVSAWEKQEYRVIPSQVVVMGASFGGTAAILSTKDPCIDKAIAFAPVVDWTAPCEECLDELEQVIVKGYGQAYRFSHEDWMRLNAGSFFQPMAEIPELDAKKIMVVHAKDDKVVSFDSVERFATVSRCQFISRRTGGHLSTRESIHWPLSSRIQSFLK